MINLLGSSEITEPKPRRKTDEPGQDMEKKIRRWHIEERAEAKREREEYYFKGGTWISLRL